MEIPLHVDALFFSFDVVQFYWISIAIVCFQIHSQLVNRTQVWFWVFHIIPSQFEWCTCISAFALFFVPFHSFFVVYCPLKWCYCCSFFFHSKMMQIFPFSFCIHFGQTNEHQMNQIVLTMNKTMDKCNHNEINLCSFQVGSF